MRNVMNVSLRSLMVGDVNLASMRCCSECSLFVVVVAVVDNGRCRGRRGDGGRLFG